MLLCSDWLHEFSYLWRHNLATVLEEASDSPSGADALHLLTKLISLITSISDGELVSSFNVSLAGISGKFTMAAVQLNCSPTWFAQQTSRSLGEWINMPLDSPVTSFTVWFRWPTFAPSLLTLRPLPLNTTFSISAQAPHQHCLRSFLMLLTIDSSEMWASHCMWHPRERICEHSTDQLKSRTTFVSGVYVARSSAWVNTGLPRFVLSLFSDPGHFVKTTGL